MRICLSFLFATGLWGQALERPAELKNIQSEYNKRTAEWDTKIRQQQANYQTALSAAKANPNDDDRLIVSTGESIKTLRLLIDREAEKIQYLERYREMAITQAGVFESRKLDEELAKQTADVRNLLDQAMASLRTRFEEAQATNSPEAQERLARSLSRVEELNGTLQRFEMAQGKEQEAASARAELARQLREEGVVADDKIWLYRNKIKLVQATMAGDMIKLRGIVDQRTTKEIIKLGPLILVKSDHDPVFDQIVGARTTHSKGSVFERVSRLLAGNQTLIEQQTNTERKTQ